MNPDNKNKKVNIKLGEARAEVDAELSLQRSSTNSPLQTAAEESQVPTVAAGPGSSGSVTNVVPREIAMVEETNQQAPAGAFSDKKRLSGTQKRLKPWLTKTVAKIQPWESANLKVSGVEILQKMIKATAWIPRNPKDPAVVLRRLEGFNPSLKTASWRIVRHERPQEASATGGLKHLLIVQVPESQARALAGLDDRPFYHLGRITFKVSGREQEGPAMETERPE